MRRKPVRKSGNGAGHSVRVEFDDFGWAALVDAAERQDVSVEELLVHAAMYYLSDEESGGIAHRVFPSERTYRSGGSRSG